MPLGFSLHVPASRSAKVPSFRSGSRSRQLRSDDLASSRPDRIGSPGSTPKVAADWSSSRAPCPSAADRGSGARLRSPDKASGQAQGGSPEA